MRERIKGKTLMALRSRSCCIIGRQLALCYEVAISTLSALKHDDMLRLHAVTHSIIEFFSGRALKPKHELPSLPILLRRAFTCAANHEHQDVSASSSTFALPSPDPSFLAASLATCTTKTANTQPTLQAEPQDGNGDTSLCRCFCAGL